RTKSSKQVSLEIRFLDALLGTQVTQLRNLISWVQADRNRHHRKVPPHQFADGLASALASMLGNALRRCPAEDRTLIAADVLCEVFKECIPQPAGVTLKWGE